MVCADVCNVSYIFCIIYALRNVIVRIYIHTHAELHVVLLLCENIKNSHSHNLALSRRGDKA